MSITQLSAMKLSRVKLSKMIKSEFFPARSSQAGPGCQAEQAYAVKFIFTLHDFLLVAEPGLVLLLSCEELELTSSSSSSSSSKFILLDIPTCKKKKRGKEHERRHHNFLSCTESLMFQTPHKTELGHHRHFNHPLMATFTN